MASTKKHDDLGQTPHLNPMRVTKWSPSLKSLPSGIESVRGAIAYLQVRKEIEQAEGRTARISNARHTSTGCADERETETYRPSAALPTSARTRDQLLAAQRQLAEIAASDAAAVRKVRAVSQQQHARIQAAAKRQTR